jgi:large subunit ribosomal protein L10e
MARKPNSMYRDITQHAYTRRKYMGGVPQSRLLQFETGAATRDFPLVLTLRTDERSQVRSQALEAGRIAGNRHLTKYVGVANYFFKVRVYPHHILRENKQATGAGADRVSQGMRRAFGAAIGQAARVSQGMALFEVRTTPDMAKRAKEALWKCSQKVAMPCYIQVDKGQELITS